jgi:hypothetical protein
MASGESRANLQPPANPVVPFVGSRERALRFFGTIGRRPFPTSVQCEILLIVVRCIRGIAIAFDSRKQGEEGS